MKRLLVLFFLIITSCTLFEPKAEVTITGLSTSLGYAYITFEIKNTGNVDIDYYEVTFEVTCTDNSKYSDWTNGLSLGAGQTRADSCYIDISSKTPSTARVTDISLTTY